VFDGNPLKLLFCFPILLWDFSEKYLFPENTFSLFLAYFLSGRWRSDPKALVGRLLAS